MEGPFCWAKECPGFLENKLIDVKIFHGMSSKYFWYDLKVGRYAWIYVKI